ncbi:tetratricopeptide repeat protein, partial [Helicobacter typhlonius]
MRCLLLFICVLWFCGCAHLSVDSQVDCGNAEDCMAKGFEFFDEANYTQAAPYFTKGCDLDSRGCFILGVLYYEGKGVKQNYNKARELFEKVCELGDEGALGCMSLGQLYYEGKGVKQDYIKAIEYTTKSCNMGEIGSCYNLGLLYGKGEGANQDSLKAKEIFTQVCNHKITAGKSGGIPVTDLMYKPMGCTALGDMYYYG